MCRVICQFSKNSLFRKKRVQKSVFFFFFSNFCVLSSFFENSLFLGLLKHYKIGVSADCFFVVEREEKCPPKMIIGIYEFGFFVQKWPFRDAQLLFKKKTCWNPNFYSVFWVRALWAKVSKRNSETHTKKRKTTTENWKVLFWYFGFFFVVFFFFLFFVFFFLFFFLFVFFVCFFCVFFVLSKGVTKWSSWKWSSKRRKSTSWRRMTKRSSFKIIPGIQFTSWVTTSRASIFRGASSLANSEWTLACSSICKTVSPSSSSCS